MSDILLEEFIESKKAIVITGTHGKTTITALVSWILKCAKLDPTVFVGGVAKNFDSTFKLGKGKYIVLEGDEYDTAFFDKGPKFWHYRPFVGLVNNIELDHVDIYRGIEAYKFAFARFINLIPKNGLLVANRYDKNVMELVNKAKAEFHVKLFGSKHENYIVNNILGAIAVARFLGVSRETIKKAIATFQGVKRRAEAIGEKNGITVIDDYAHHPTAVRETLDFLKLKYGVKHRLFLVFEPGSASSKRRVFEKQYIEAFRRADIAYIYKPFKAGGLKPSEMFHGNLVASSLKRRGVPARSFDDLDNLLFHMRREAKPGDVIVIMSCRGFDNLYKLIWDVL